MSALRSRTSVDARLERRRYRTSAHAAAAASPAPTRNSRQSSQIRMRDAADEEQHVADPGQRGLRGDALDLADVVVDARDDVAEARRSRRSAATAAAGARTARAACRTGCPRTRACTCRPLTTLSTKPAAPAATNSSDDALQSAARCGRPARRRRAILVRYGSQSESAVLIRLIGQHDRRAGARVRTDVAEGVARSAVVHAPASARLRRRLCGLRVVRRRQQRERRHVAVERDRAHAA